MSYHTPFVVSLKAYDADESRKKSSLSRSKEKRLPPLPSPSSPLQPANVPSPPQDSSITSRTLSSGHPTLSTKMMPPKNTDHHHSFAAASQRKCTAARRIIRKQLGGGVTDSTILQQRSQYPDPDPTSQSPEPTTISRESSRDTDKPPSATAAGDSEDDEATLVSSSDAHACKDSRDGKVSFKDSGPSHPSNVLHRKILDHIPGFSDDESDDANRVASNSSRRRSSRSRTPTPPSQCWGVRATTHIDFQVSQEERAIPANTALRPPPWHHQASEKYVVGVRPTS